MDGDLDLGGTGIYVGIIIVRGTIRSSGNPSIYGAVIANAVDVIQGTPTIQYSQCAVDRAIIENENVTRARPLTNRGFIDMSSVGN